MKPFDIEAAKAGAKVITRDGRDIRIICFNMSGSAYPIVALVCNQDGDENLRTFRRDGVYYPGSVNNEDLFMAPVKKEGWINLYKNTEVDRNFVAQTIYRTKEDAERNILLTLRHIATVHIEWEE